MTDTPSTVLARHDFVSATGRHLRIYGELRGRPTSDLPRVEPSALHQRHDALTDTWVAISPSRNVRPHTVSPGTGPAPAQTAGLEAAAGERAASGSEPAAPGSEPAAPGSEPSASGSEPAVSGSEPAVSARGLAALACPLCPGGPEVPFSYEAAVFDNRFPSFVAEPPPAPVVAGALPGELAPSLGRCEVVLYTEHHVGSLATLTPMELARVVAVWRDRTSELWADARLAFVMAFENRGEAVGATISHPHGQIYAFDRLPPFVAWRVEALSRSRTADGRCLSCRVVARDAAGDRVVADNASFVVAVPFAPHWPYEIHVRARRHGARRLADLEPAEQRDLAAALRGVVLRYDALFGFELPYMMVALEGPPGAEDWHLAFEFLPPHRSERLTKVRASVETATGLFINDTLPEAIAARLAGLGVEERAEAPPLRVEPAGRPR